MKRYVVCLFQTPKGIAFVRKTKPDWQAGLLNLPGGHVEDNDGTDENAAIREVREETGYQLDRAYYCGQIVGPDYRVGCYYGVGAQKTAEVPDQQVEFVPAPSVRQTDNMIPNLYLIVPLMLACIQGWTVQQGEDGLEREWRVAL